AQTRPLAGAAQKCPFPLHAHTRIVDESGGDLVFHPAESVAERGELHQSWPTPQTHGRLYCCLQPTSTSLPVEEAGCPPETLQNNVRSLMQLDTRQVSASLPGDEWRAEHPINHFLP